MDLDFFLRHPKSTPFFLAYLGSQGAQDLLRFWLDAESCQSSVDAAQVILKFLRDQPPTPALSRLVASPQEQKMRDKVVFFDSDQSDWFDDIVQDEDKVTPQERQNSTRSREYLLETVRRGLKHDSLERIISAAVRIVSPQEDVTDRGSIAASGPHASLRRDSLKRVKKELPGVAAPTMASPDNDESPRLSSLLNQVPYLEEFGDVEEMTVYEAAAGAMTPPRQSKRKPMVSESPFPANLPSPVYDSIIGGRVPQPPEGLSPNRKFLPGRQAQNDNAQMGIEIHGRDAVCVLQAIVQRVLQATWWPRFRQSTHFREHNDDLRARFFEVAPESGHPLQLEDVLQRKSDYFRSYLAHEYGPRVQNFANVWKKLSKMRSALLGVVNRKWISTPSMLNGSTRANAGSPVTSSRANSPRKRSFQFSSPRNQAVRQEEKKADGANTARIVLQCLCDQGLLSWSNAYINPEVYVGPSLEEVHLSASDSSDAEGEQKINVASQSTYPEQKFDVNERRNDLDRQNRTSITSTMKVSNRRGIFDEIVDDATVNGLSCILDAQEACRRLMVAKDDLLECAFEAATSLLRAQEDLFKWFLEDAWPGFIQSDTATDMLTTIDSGNSAALIRHRSLMTVVREHMEDTGRNSITLESDPYSSDAPLYKAPLLWDGDVVVQMRVRRPTREEPDEDVTSRNSFTEGKKVGVGRHLPRHNMSPDGIRIWAHREDQKLGDFGGAFRAQALTLVGMNNCCNLMEQLLLERDIVIIYQDGGAKRSQLNAAKGLLIELVDLLRPLELPHRVVVKDAERRKTISTLRPANSERSLDPSASLEHDGTNVPVVVLTTPQGYRDALLKAATTLENHELGLEFGSGQGVSLGVRLLKASAVLDMATCTIKAGTIAPKSHRVKVSISKSQSLGQNLPGQGNPSGFFIALVNLVASASAATDASQQKKKSTGRGIMALSPLRTSATSRESKGAKNRRTSFRSSFITDDVGLLADLSAVQIVEQTTMDGAGVLPTTEPGSNPRLLPLSIHYMNPGAQRWLPAQVSGSIPEVAIQKTYVSLRTAVISFVRALVYAMAEHMRLVPLISSWDDAHDDLSSVVAESEASAVPSSYASPFDGQENQKIFRLPVNWFALINAQFYISNTTRKLYGKQQLRFGRPSLDWDTQPSMALGALILNPSPSMGDGMSLPSTSASRLSAETNRISEKSMLETTTSWGEARQKATSKRLKSEGKTFLKRFLETSVFASLIEERANFLAMQLANIEPM